MNRFNQHMLDQIRRLREPDEENSMVCPECGAYMENEDLYDWKCPECGYTFSEEQWMDHYEND